MHHGNERQWQAFLSQLPDAANKEMVVVVDVLKLAPVGVSLSEGAGSLELKGRSISQTHAM
jgi:hypothetical protein